MTAHKEGDPTTLSRLYGRSVGKPLRARQQALVDELLPKISASLSDEKLPLLATFFQRAQVRQPRSPLPPPPLAIGHIRP